MRLIVDHITRYSYDAPVRSVVQSQRMTPSLCKSQNVLSWQVSVSGGVKGAAFRDGAGDWIESWSISGPVDEITVHVRGEVETSDTLGILRDHREVITPAVYLRSTPATDVSAALITLAEEAEGKDPLSLAHALSAVVSEALVYTPGVTQAHTTAAEALALGEGVCQDHAHALIAIARVRGMPARYVSGYLFADAEGKSHEAAHAWAEIFVPGLGWVGFDPVNKCCPDERYIRLASGLDAMDAAPIRGIKGRTVGDESLEVSVAVRTSGQ